MLQPPADAASPLILIDESLPDRPLAAALKLMDYNAQAVTEVPDLGQGARDPVLIRWLGMQQGMWATVDERARRQHSEVIRQAGVHILWVQRPRHGGLNKRQYLRLLLGVLDPILEQIARARRPLQFRAYYSGERPKWERIE